MAHPGKKLLFMGGEFGQYIEWKYDDSLDWHLPQQYPMHRKLLEYSKALNQFYCENKSFWQVDFDWNGFQWIDCNDNENSIVSFVRKAEDESDYVIAVCNFTPEVHTGYRIGVPEKGVYREVFNSDLEIYGGSDVKNEGDIHSEDVVWHNREQSVTLTIPPLATIYLKRKGTADEEQKKAAPASRTRNQVKKTEKPAAKKAATETAKKTTAKRTAAEKPAAEKTVKEAAKQKSTRAKTAKKTETSKEVKSTAEKKTTAAGAKKSSTDKKPAAKTTAAKGTAKGTSGRGKTAK
jgi:1,4-alpha-glucan branching enzyme